MVDVRRAYGRWLWRRLFWLLPSLLLSILVCFHLVTEADMPGWARIPSLAVAGGVTSFFIALTTQAFRVVRERAMGRSRRAQLLRTELRPYPGLGFVSLLLLLVLLAAPALFPKPAPLPAPPEARRPILVEEAKRPAKIVLPPPPVEEPAASVPQIVPEIALVIPELPAWEELELPLLPRVQDTPPSAEEALDVRHRPVEGFRLTFDRADLFDRAGLPTDQDHESWIPPDIRLELMMITSSGPWRGAAVEASFELPFGRDDSFRVAAAGFFVTDADQLHGFQPSLSWNRGTVEYVRRLAGYTRASTFDFALRLGLAGDQLRTHDTDLHIDSEIRLSPWIGFETGLWEVSGVGLVIQGGHSPGLALAGGISKVTDFKVIVQLDLGEQSTLELGYRLVAVHFRDRNAGSSDPEPMERQFKGPIAALTLRF